MSPSGYGLGTRLPTVWTGHEPWLYYGDERVSARSTPDELFACQVDASGVAHRWLSLQQVASDLFRRSAGLEPLPRGLVPQTLCCKLSTG